MSRAFQPGDRVVIVSTQFRFFELDSRQVRIVERVSPGLFNVVDAAGHVSVSPITGDSLLFDQPAVRAYAEVIAAYEKAEADRAVQILAATERINRDWQPVINDLVVHLRELSPAAEATGRR